MNDDLISRQAVLDFIDSMPCEVTADGHYMIRRIRLTEYISDTLPSAQQTLYGYKVKHLAYIARVMEKEGVTAEYAVRTFDDMGRAIKMIIEEAQQKVEETMNERFNQPTGCD